jgi:hypothetical protein
MLKWQPRAVVSTTKFPDEFAARKMNRGSTATRATNPPRSRRRRARCWVIAAMMPAHVRDRGVDARPNRKVAAAAHGNRALVIENVIDFASERDIPVVCVLKSRLPAKGMAVRELGDQPWWGGV